MNRLHRIDVALLMTSGVALGLAGLVSARWGAVTLGLSFLVGALFRRAGVASLLLVQRRQQTDLVVLSVFGVGLIALALVLP